MNRQPEVESAATFTVNEVRSIQRIALPRTKLIGYVVLSFLLLLCVANVGVRLYWAAELADEYQLGSLFALHGRDWDPETTYQGSSCWAKECLLEAEQFTVLGVIVICGLLLWPIVHRRHVKATALIRKHGEHGGQIDSDSPDGGK